MPRLVLAQKDVFYKTKSIFENLRGKEKIYLRFSSGGGSHIFFKRGPNPCYEITIDENSKFCKPYSTFEHEISHYIDDTPVKFIAEVCKALAKDLPEKYRERGKRIIKSIYNIIEDTRVDSNYGKLHPGFAKRRVEFRKLVGKSNVNNIDNPIDAIFAARFDRGDLVKDSKWPEAIEYIKKVEFKGRSAGVLLTKKYFESLVKPWFLSQVIPPETEMLNLSGSETGEQKDGKTGEQGRDKDSGKGNEEDRDSNYTKNQVRLDQSLANADQFDGDHDDFKEAEPLELDIDVTENDEEFEKALEESQKEEEEVLEKLKRRLDEVQSQKHIDPNVIPTVEGRVMWIDRPVSDVQVDYGLAHQLNRLFRTIKGKYAEDIDEDGTQIDLDEYIQFKVRKQGNIFEDEKIDNGLAVTILVDCSGSMSGVPLDIARNISATLFYSLKKIDNIELSVIGFSAPERFYALAVVDINRLEDIGRLTGVRGYPYTPTHLAIQYAQHILNNKKAAKKLLIVVTDGSPQMSTQYREVNRDWLTSLARKAVRDCKKSGITLLSIYTGGASDGYMETIFGSGFTTATDMEQAAHIMTSHFRRQVVQYLKVR